MRVTRHFRKRLLSPAAQSPAVPARQEAGLTPTSRHEEGDAEPALEHPLPQRGQAGPVEGEGAADEDVQHDAKALPTTRRHGQRRRGPTGRPPCRARHARCSRCLPRCPAGGLRTPSPRTPPGPRTGGSRTTWTEALPTCRNSQIQSLKDEERNDVVMADMAGAACHSCAHKGQGPSRARAPPRPPGSTSWRSTTPTCQLDVHVAVQQQVLGLEVPVHDVMAVAVLHSRQDLPEFLPCLALTQVPVRGQVV